MEYRRRTACFRTRIDFQSASIGELDGSKAACEVLQGKAFHWWQVSDIDQTSSCMVVDFLNRFVSPDIRKKYDLELPEYEGIDQIVEVGSNGQKL